MKKTLVALALFSTAIGTAHAADMPVKAPVYVAPFTWTGVYLGINAGYGWASDTTGDYSCINPAGVVAGPGCSFSQPAALKQSGGFVGGQLGANYQTGMFVWGVEADIQVAHINDSVTTGVPPFAGGTLLRAANLDWFGTVRGRLGLAIWDRTLIYGTGGVMYGEEVINTSVTFPAVTYQAQSSGTRTGWVAGGGIEYAFTNNISAKVEGLAYDLGSQVIAFKSPVTAFGIASDYKYTGGLVRLGANLKFGP
jgi:outer membrane immunogenic protein